MNINFMAKIKNNFLICEDKKENNIKGPKGAIKQP
jgi:hypothetical protein